MQILQEFLLIILPCFLLEMLQGFLLGVRQSFLLKTLLKSLLKILQKWFFFSGNFPGVISVNSQKIFLKIHLELIMESFRCFFCESCRIFFSGIPQRVPHEDIPGVIPRNALHVPYRSSPEDPGEIPLVEFRDPKLN